MGGLSSCSGFTLSEAKVLSRNLPSLPAWAVPEYAARPALPIDLVEVGELEKQRADRNAGRLKRLGDWYGERRREFAAP